MMEAGSIEAESLARLQARCLFYPSAGSDWDEFLVKFDDHIDKPQMVAA